MGNQEEVVCGNEREINTESIKDKDRNQILAGRARESNHDWVEQKWKWEKI